MKLTLKTIKAALNASRKTGTGRLGNLTITHTKTKTMNSANKISPRYAKDRYVTRLPSGEVLTDHEGCIDMACQSLLRLHAEGKWSGAIFMEDVKPYVEAPAPVQHTVRVLVSQFVTFYTGQEEMTEDEVHARVQRMWPGMNMEVIEWEVDPIRLLESAPRAEEAAALPLHFEELGLTWEHVGTDGHAVVYLSEDCATTRVKFLGGEARPMYAERSGAEKLGAWLDREVTAKEAEQARVADGDDALGEGA